MKELRNLHGVGNFKLRRYGKLFVDFLTESAGISRDVMPYICLRRIPPTVLGINRVGLKRNGFSDDQLLMISEAYRTVFRRNLSAKMACEWLKEQVQEHPYLIPMLDMLASSERGIVR